MKNLITPTRVAVLILLVLIALFAAWSKLRFIDARSHEPQRWRLQDYPGFQHKQSGLNEVPDRQGLA